MAVLCPVSVRSPPKFRHGRVGGFLTPKTGSCIQLQNSRYPLPQSWSSTQTPHTPQAGPSEDTPKVADLLSAVRLWTPRQTVRVDENRTHQYVEQLFPTTTPDVPYALYLADVHGQFRIFAVDFDDTDGTDPAADADHFSRWLHDHNIRHVLQRSGGGHGRHVWIVLTQPAPARVVADAARRLQKCYRSVDPSALLNPATGCLRPPGAPHRTTSEATVIASDGAALPLDAAIAVIVDAAQGATPALWAHLFASYPKPETCTGPERSNTAASTGLSATPKQPHHSNDFDETNPQSLPAIRYLTGQNRTPTNLPHDTQRALTAPLQRGEDASARARRILLGCVRAQWCIDDVLRLLPAKHAGLIHLTHRRVGSSRTPRSNAKSHTVRQFRRAQQWLARNPHTPAAGPRHVDQAAADILRTADLDPALRGTADTITLRIALEGMLHFCITAGAVEIDLSVRRWAVATGLSANTIARLSHELQRLGYLTCTQPHAGTKANRYRIHPPTSPVTRVTQGEPAPVVPNLPHHLRQRLAHFTRDAWDSHRGLGWDTALLAWALRTGTRKTAELCELTGLAPGRIQVLVDRLRAVKLLPKRGLIPKLGRSSTTRAARSLGVDGLLAQRARRYVAETIRWAWLHQELSWRTARRGNKPAPNDVFLRVQLGKFPTTTDGRLDLTAALVRVENALDTAA